MATAVLHIVDKLLCQRRAAARIGPSAAARRRPAQSLAGAALPGGQAPLLAAAARGVAWPPVGAACHRAFGAPALHKSRCPRHITGGMARLQAAARVPAAAGAAWARVRSGCAWQGQKRAAQEVTRHAHVPCARACTCGRACTCMVQVLGSM
eukprot:30676-Chlamydomonas_euryale.AAC.3